MNDCFVEENNMLSDIELVKKVRSGNYDYLQLLIRRYMPCIQKTAARYEGYGCDREDLVQEGMLAVYSSAKAFDSEKSSYAAFVSLCINRAMLSQAKATLAGRRIPESLFTSIENVNISDNSTPEEIVIDREQSVLFADRIRSILSDMEYKVFSRFLSGQSYAEIAKDLCVSVKSVDNSLKRVRSKLKRDDTGVN